MKYLVIWFCLVSGFSSVEGYEQYNFKPKVEEVRINSTRVDFEYRNYAIVDTIEEAKKIADDKLSGWVGNYKVYIYELGKQYEAKAIPYKTLKTVEQTHYTIEIKEKE